MVHSKAGIYTDGVREHVIWIWDKNLKWGSPYFVQKIKHYYIDHVKGDYKDERCRAQRIKEELFAPAEDRTLLV
jgi:hypothetical protein